MTQKQILEGNKLIAKFMGWKKDNNVSNERYYKEGDVSKNLCNFSYNKSWDWLMPVVEKIESLGFWINIKKNHVTVAYDNKNTYDSKMIHSEFGDISKIERVYICVINFIKFYNELETGK